MTSQSVTQQLSAQWNASDEHAVHVQHSMTQLEPVITQGPPVHWRISHSETVQRSAQVIATPSFPVTQQSSQQELKPRLNAPPEPPTHVQASTVLAAPTRITEPMQSRTWQSYTSFPVPRRHTAPAPETASAGHTHARNTHSLT